MVHALSPSSTALAPARDSAATIAVGLGLGALGLAVCVRAPALLTSPEVRELYPLALLLHALRVLALAALVLSVLVVARRRAAPGTALAAMALALGAVGLAGAKTGLVEANDGEGLLGLDWLVFDALVVGLVIVPLERRFAQRRGPLLRKQWATDLRYFLVNHLGVHGLGVVAALFAVHTLGWAHRGLAATGIAQWPLVAQVLLLLLVADLIQYALHRAMHEIPWLWRIHAVHHSSEHLDALAGSRIHLVETLITRTTIYAAFFALGMPVEAFLGYAAVMAIQGTFIHANVGFRYGWLEQVLVSPRFHHWHHSSDAEAIDTNYAGTFPFLDRLFGTYKLPHGNRWPERYGVVKELVPTTFFGQQRFPFAPARSPKEPTA